LEDLGLGGSIILKHGLKKIDGRAWIGLIWLNTVVGGSEHCNVPPVSIKCEEFLV
jgi:hypothetical protein